MSPGSGTFEREFPFALSRWAIFTGQPFFFFSLYLGELGGLRGREKVVKVTNENAFSIDVICLD